MVSASYTPKPLYVLNSFFQSVDLVQ